MRSLMALGILGITLGGNLEHKEHAMNNQIQNHHHQHQHGAPAHQHGEPPTGAQLIVATDPANPIAGRPVKLRLMIHAADGTMVRDFDVVHEEKVHLVVVREGLDQFAHIHPAADDKGNLTVTHTFPVGGTYRLFADYTPTGGDHATAKGIVVIGGPSLAAPISPSSVAVLT